jgi:RNA polymerase sigma factor (sigma-70 family)
MQDADLDLLGKWRSGERQAGEQLFARHFREIYRFFEHKVGRDADELVQRTFLACVSARGQFRCQSTFRTYLFTIARHELYDYLGQQARFQGQQNAFEITSIADLATSPSARLARAQEIDELRRALSRLPAEQQLLLELHYWHQLGADSLSEVFATEPGAIRVRLLRARRALRAMLTASELSELAGGGGDRLAASVLAPDLDGEAPSPKEGGGL